MGRLTFENHERCDDFTREFFARAGMSAGAEEPVPRDEAHRSQIVRPTSAGIDGVRPFSSLLLSSLELSDTQVYEP